MQESKKNIRDFIDKISKIQNSKTDKGLTERELKEIAIEMGMTEEEWQNVEKTFNDHITRGKGFLDYDNWDDAFDEFQQAGTLKPDHIEVLYGLARVYTGRWISKGNKKNRERANEYAKRCIQIDPAHKEALILISSLKKTRKSGNRVLGFVIGGIVLTLVLFIGISFFLLYIPVDKTVREMEQPPEPEQVFIFTNLTLNQILVPYITCINRHSQRIYQSYNRYLSWLDDPEAGPAGGTGSIYGLYDIYDSDKHLQSIRDMNNRAAEYPDLSLKGNEYSEAFEGLKPILAQALDYYETENYRDDDFKKGQELHAPLLFAFKKYIRADRALRTLIEKLQVDAGKKVKAILSKKGKNSKEYQILHLAEAASAVMQEAISLDKDITRKDQFLKSFMAFDAAHKEFSNLLKTEEKNWGISRSYPDNYKELIQTLVYYRRAAEKGNTREAYRTTTIYKQLVDDYNSTIDACNHEITYTFPSELNYLRLKIPLELIYPVD